MKKNTTQKVAFGGVIAALYVVLTMIAAAMGVFMWRSVRRTPPLPRSLRS